MRPLRLYYLYFCRLNLPRLLLGMFVYTFAQKSKHTVTVLTDFELGLHPFAFPYAALHPVRFWQATCGLTQIPIVFLKDLLFAY